MRTIIVKKQVPDDLCEGCPWFDEENYYEDCCDIFGANILYKKPCQACLDATVKEDNHKSEVSNEN